MVPAGGETGRPHCLAEVYKAVKTALYFKQIIKELKVNENSAKRINNRTGKQGVYFHTPSYLNGISIQLIAVKSKLKIFFFVFFRTLLCLNRSRKILNFGHLRLPVMVRTDKSLKLSFQ